MLSKNIHGFVLMNISFFFTIFAIMTDVYGKEPIDSGEIAGVFILLLSPFAWRFIREIESKKQELGHYPTFLSQITDIKKNSLFSLISIIAFVALIFLGGYVRQNNKILSDWLMSAGFIILLLCIILIIYRFAFAKRL
jgi:hypothetical protein